MSKIQWTNETWNPVTGCQKVSPGCKFCYAEGIANRFFATEYSPNLDGSLRKFTDVRCHADRLDLPFTWKSPRMAFVNSMSDLFHEGVPEEFIDRVVAVMALTKNHTYQILTKRAARMADYFSSLQRRSVPISLSISRTSWYERNYISPIVVGQRPVMEIEDRISRGPLQNIWLGVSVENPDTWGQRVALLKQMPAAIHFVSNEPALADLGTVDLSGIDWIICGGESGPGARPFNLPWAESLLAQCRKAGIPFFMKQVGSLPFDGRKAVGHSDKGTMYERLHLRDSKGGDPAEWPESLRVRELPQWSKTSLS